MKNSRGNKLMSGVWGLTLLGLGTAAGAGEFPDGLKAVKVFAAPDTATTFVLADDGELYTWGIRIPGTPFAAMRS